MKLRRFFKIHGMRIGLIASVIFVLSALLLQPHIEQWSDPAKKKLDAAQPDQDAYAAFTLENALSSMQHIRDSLGDFRRLSEQLRQENPPKNLEAFANARSEVQTIGFPNFLSVVEGTLYRQQYERAKAEYEAARSRFTKGEIAPAELHRAKTALEKAEKSMQEFWVQYRAAD